MVSRFTNCTKAVQRLASVAVLLCAAGLVFPCAHAQQSDADKKQLQETKAKAERGDAGAQNKLGVCYKNGQGVTRDYVEAVKWFRKAAEQNHAMAQTMLGDHYADGEGVAQDFKEAVKWYRKAADQNFGLGQYMLGQNYDHGLGVEEDHAEAVKLYRKAAEQNVVPAQHDLGNCYRDGHGVAKDYVEAYAWYNLAAEFTKHFGVDRDELEKKMSPKEIDDAKKRAKELRANIAAKLKSGGK